MWRTGANKATALEISTDLNIGGVDVPAGKYAVFTKPGMSSWQVMLYNNTELWGVPDEMVDSLIVANFSVKPSKSTNKLETMLINFDNLRNDGATMDICWESTAVSIPIKAPTDDLVAKTIEKTMGGPSAGDYYRAARYYRESGKDLDQALTWMNKSLEMNGDKFWTLRQKALLLADMGKYKDAITVAKKSIEMAKEAGNEGYVKSNEESITEWMKK